MRGNHRHTSERTDTFPKGETSCWSAVILSPSFSFLTCSAKEIFFSDPDFKRNKKRLAELPKD
jgi:hypothetical protein